MLSLVAALSVVAAARSAAASELPFGSLVPGFSIAGVGGAGELPGSVHVAAAAVVVAAAFDPNMDACSTAIDVVTYCYDTLPTAAALLDQAYCFCCNDDGTTTDVLAPVYSSCEAYIDTAAATDTDASSAISIVADFCSSVSGDGFSCGVASATATATPDFTTSTAAGSATHTSATAAATATAATTKAATTGAATTGRPAGCSLFGSVYNSCSSAKRGFSTMNDAQAASCLCYTDGHFTTALDDYISQCGVWIATASPDDYETYVSLETYCEDYAPTSVVATFSDKIATFGGNHASSTASDAASAATTPTPTKTPKTVTVTPTASSTSPGAANAAGRAAQGGFAAWLAVVLPLIL